MKVFVYYVNIVVYAIILQYLAQRQRHIKSSVIAFGYYVAILRSMKNLKTKCLLLVFIALRRRKGSFESQPL
ncbi:hypothetical protein CR513_16151, partial [Mucuna pruriens]